MTTINTQTYNEAAAKQANADKDTAMLDALQILREFVELVGMNSDTRKLFAEIAFYVEGNDDAEIREWADDLIARAKKSLSDYNAAHNAFLEAFKG